MIRLPAALLAALACLGTASAFAEPALRPVATVSGPVVHLGDLFSDAGAHGADAVAPAPPPGSRTLFDAAWLAATATAHQLSWQPASRFDQVSVERASRVVTADRVTDRLLAEIAKRQPVDGAEIELDDAGLRILVASEAPDTIAVEGLTVDPRNGRFSALVSAPAGDADAERQRVGGRIVRMLKLPVLNHPVAPGDTIRAGDLETMTLRADRIGADVLADTGDVIGKTPRRPLRAHEPLRPADVQVPVVVHKGDLVTIVLETPTMRLTAQGKALEDGGSGAVIRIANTKSSRVIDAVVTGPNLAAVAMSGQLAARQESSR